MCAGGGIKGNYMRHLSAKNLALAAMLSLFFAMDVGLAVGQPTDVARSADEKYGGFGAAATGGAGHSTIEVRTYEELRDALLKGNANVVVKVPEIFVLERIETKASNITVDGRGATIRGDKMKSRTDQMLKFSGGKNLIVKNCRFRNGGDNLAFYKGAQDIVVAHCSSTGAGDDGISISNGAGNATITHCFLAGNTRAVFCKYQGTSRITVDHCIICKFWIRGPMFSDVDLFDVRNNLIMDWVLYGIKPEAGSNGNVMGNLCVLTKPSVKAENGVNLIRPGRVFVKDNGFRGNARPGNEARMGSTASAPLDAPPIVPAYTADLGALEHSLMSDTAGAGCMPRDSVDKAYLAATNWHVSESIPFRIPETGEPLPN
jgi:pectate lyase